VIVPMRDVCWAWRGGTGGSRTAFTTFATCRVRSGSAPQILAGVRNAVLPLLAGVNPKNSAAAIRYLAAKPLKAIRLVCPKAEN
jgi:hypothetical protein